MTSGDRSTAWPRRRRRASADVQSATRWVGRAIRRGSSRRRVRPDGSGGACPGDREGPQLTAAVAQNAQRVIQDRPGAAVGAVLAELGLLIVRRRQRRRAKTEKVQLGPRAVPDKSGLGGGRSPCWAC